MYKTSNNQERRTNEMVTSNKIINRHKARILSDLEEADCPLIFRNAVISGLNWLRSDIDKHERTGSTHDTTEQTDSIGNR